jgi:uroporphyrinogen-III synthase
MIKKIFYTGLTLPFGEKRPNMIHCPLIQTIPYPIEDLNIQEKLKNFSSYTHLILTSKTTVHLLIKSLFLFGYSVEAWLGKTVICVGQSTAHCLGSYGLLTHVLAKEETSEGIIQELRLQPLEQAFLFWPHSAQSRPVIRDFLINQQLNWSECILYETTPLIPDPLPILEEFDEIVFTSPSTIEAFLTIFGSFLPHQKLTCIGPITRRYLEEKIQFIDSYPLI